MDFDNLKYFQRKTLYACVGGESECLPPEIDSIFDFVYLHGDLEKEVGYDLVFCDSALTNIRRNGDLDTGIFDVNIVVPNLNNKTYNAIIFYWEDNQNTTNIVGKTHGLICLKNDEEACKYALEIYKNKSMCI